MVQHTPPPHPPVRNGGEAQWSGTSIISHRYLYISIMPVGYFIVSFRTGGMEVKDVSKLPVPLFGIMGGLISLAASLSQSFGVMRHRNGKRQH